MSCNCGKPKCNGKCGISPAVLQINNPDECTLFHKVTVPASMGDSKTNPPKNGDYRNVLLYFEADETSWMFSSDGIPTQLVDGMTNYEEAQNLPSINSHTLLGNMSGSDLDLQDKLTAGNNIQITGTTISATDTTYDDFVGATSDAAGEAGLVPAPASGVTEKFLKSDGTWSDTTAFLPYPASVAISGTTPEFIASIQALNAEVGTAYLGTVSLTDLPEGLVQEEVMAYVYDNSVIYLTLRSADTAPYIWNCNSYAYRGWEPIDTTAVTILWANSTESGNTRHLYSDSAMYNAVSMDDVINAAHKGLLFVRLANPLTPEQYNESVLVNVWVSPNDNDYQAIFTDGNYTYNYGADALTDTAFMYSTGQYQRKLTAGAGIDITGNTISVKDPAPEDFFDGPATDSGCGTSISLDGMISGQPASLELKGDIEQTDLRVNQLFIPDGTWSNNGVTAVVSNGTITLNRTSSSGSTSFIRINMNSSINIPAGVPFTFSANNPSTVGSAEPYAAIRLNTGSGDDATTDVKFNTQYASGTFTKGSATTYATLVIRTASSISYTNFVIEPQLSIDSPSTAAPQTVNTVTGAQTITVNGNAYAVDLGSENLCEGDKIYNSGNTWYKYSKFGRTTDSIGSNDITISGMKPDGEFYSYCGGVLSGTTITYTATLTVDNYIFYELATPSTNAVTDASLIAQLNAVKLASGANTITFSTSGLLGELCIEGYVDNWNGNLAKIYSMISDLQ